jgi:hypothetical protein
MLTAISMDAELERRHIATGPEPGERPTGLILMTVTAVSDGRAQDVLVRAKEVLSAVLANRDTSDLDEWRRLLPPWFVDRCAPERTREEAERWLAWWRKLPPAEQGPAEDAKGWSLADWLYWFEPEQRFWFWWDARVLDPSRVQVVIDSYEAPPPVDALRWLLQASGADQVTPDWW